MAFNSVIYLIFLPGIAFIHYFTPRKARWIVLLAASCWFYMAWRPEFIILLAFTVLVNYSAALLIHKTKFRKPILVICIIINLSLLFLFKYLGFFSDTIRTIFSIMQVNVTIPEYSIILPLGISFYTFQAMGYTIDVYRGNQKCEPNFFKTLLFIIFFPLLIAGPIERAGGLMGQLSAGKRPRLQDVYEGLGYLMLGFFRKCVVADRLAELVNVVYGAPAAYTGLPSIIATLFFAFQIYNDFGGYSDIAIGSAKLLGIEATPNFRQPYISGSIREFWQRWHITLSTWFRDYVYRPISVGLVKRKWKLKSTYFVSSFTVWLLTGLWHGANWTFVIWGALHGAIQYVESLLNAKPPKRNIFNVGLTFILVCVAWVFFRANNIQDAIFILTHILKGIRSWKDFQYIYQTLSGMGVTFLDVLINVGLIIIIIIIDLFAWDDLFIEKSFRVLKFFSIVLLAILFILIMALSKFYSGGQFIYFQF